MCIIDSLSRLLDHNATEGNKAEVKGLNITVHDIFPDIKTSPINALNIYGIIFPFRAVTLWWTDIQG